jgi:hypothetical protein
MPALPYGACYKQRFKARLRVRQWGNALTRHTEIEMGVAPAFRIVNSRHTLKD